MATFPTQLQARFSDVRQRIESACRAAGRAPDSVILMAVSKTFPAEAVRAVMDCGQRHFGENYVQEAVAKMDALAASDGQAVPPERASLIWHFIGPIQSNKTRLIAERFDWVHSVDREKIARRLSEQRPEGLPPLQTCIEVNVSGEASKNGVAPADVAALAQIVASLPRLRLRGLMTVPEPTLDMALQRRRFGQLRDLLETLRQGGLAVDTLSMGMSSDLEAAIAEGTTMVRVGTAIFGQRDGRIAPAPASPPA